MNSRAHKSSSGPAASARPATVPPADPAPGRPRTAFFILAGGLLILPWIIAPARFFKQIMIEPKWPFMWLVIFATLAAAAWSTRRAPKLNPDAPAKFLMAGAGAILVGLAVTTVASPVPGLGLMVSLREAFFVLFAVSIALLRPTRSERGLVIHAMLIAMALQAALALTQLTVPALAFGNLRGRKAMLGTIGNPEYLASWLAAGLVMAVVLWRDMLRGYGWAARRVVFPVAAAGLMLAVLFLSGGRGAALSALGSLLLGWIVLKIRALFGNTEEPDTPLPHRRSPLIGLGVAFALAAVIGAMWLGMGSQRPGSLPGRLVEMTNLQSNSMRQRLGMISVTVHMIAARPLLGSGPGHYGAAFGQTLADLAANESGTGWWTLADVLSVQMVTEAHSDWMQWWAEYGLLPALGLTLMLGVALAQGWRVRGDWTIGALMLALLVFALSMWVSFPLHTPTRALYFWTLLGMLAGAAPQARIPR